MSDRVGADPLVEVRPEDLEELVRAAHQLAESALRLASCLTDSRHRLAEFGEWVEIEGESPPEGLSDLEFQYREWRFRTVEEGPPHVPREPNTFGIASLPVHPDIARQRTHRAFAAGFWARAALDCNLPYHHTDPLPATPEHWIVLRGGLEVDPPRFESRAGFDRFTVGHDDRLIWECYGSLAEVHIFCIGARIQVPRWLVWRSRF